MENLNTETFQIPKLDDLITKDNYEAIQTYIYHAVKRLILLWMARY